jgi:nucleoside-diphosphate-sugar epimerase
MNILITGANNYIAKDLINFFSKKKTNYIIATYRKKVQKLIKKNVIYKKLDLKKKIFIKNKIDALIHCAAATPTKFYTKEQYQKINVQGFQKLLKLCQKRTKYIILLSTISVYGKINSKIISEKTSLKGNNDYAKTKIIMENQLKNFAKKNKTRILILRLPGVIGSIPNQNTFLNTVISKIKKNSKFNIYNPETLFNNLVTTKILYRVINKFMHRESQDRIELYNCATTNPKKLISIISYISNILKKKSKFNIVQSAKKSFTISTFKLIKNQYPLKTTFDSLKETL